MTTVMGIISLMEKKMVKKIRNKITNIRLYYRVKIQREIEMSPQIEL